MQAHMKLEEARKVERLDIVIGQTYNFYSDCVGCETNSGALIRSYSGQPVTVLSQDEHGDAETLPLYTVRAANGDTFTANEGELNGWIFDTGQWVGPRIN